MGHPSARDWRMAMKFGQLYLFENPMDRSEKEIVDEQFDIMARAEEFGFDSVWLAEHHFSEYGDCASPAVPLAALATRTQKVRLGTGVVVLPLNHPLRVAEDFAILDLLSGGRVDLGVGRGYQPHEFAGYGLDQARAALREHGRNPAGFEIAGLTMTYVAETTQQALADFRDAVMWYYKTFARYIAPP